MQSVAALSREDARVIYNACGVLLGAQKGDRTQALALVAPHLNSLQGEPSKEELGALCRCALEKFKYVEERVCHSSASSV